MDGEDPNKEGELDVPKRDGDELSPNGDAEVVPGVPNVLVEDEPNGEELKAGVETPNGEVPNADVFEANGFEDMEEEKGFAEDWPNVDEVPNGFDCALDVPNGFDCAVAVPNGFGCAVDVPNGFGCAVDVPNGFDCAVDIPKPPAG